jgi:endonuclease YncB( thermonuclease family)
MGELIPLMRRSRRRLPAAWHPYLRRRGVSAAQVRMMVWAGLLFGLLCWQALRLWSLWQVAPGYTPPIALPAAPVDPYAEARRSRAILDAQERAPSPAIPNGSPLDVPGSRAPARVSAQVHVIDGDTFDYGGARVRIADIDAPEVHGQCAYETALAAHATERMRALLAAGPFELSPLGNGRDEDRYGRKLRIVTRGGRSLGDVLVAEGLARTWSGRREPWC